VTNTKSGHIKGSYENESDVEAEKIVVYAYKKGTYNADIETQPQGDDGITFRNAAGSAEVKQSITGSSYTLAFLEEGDYELHFVAYNRDAASGRFSYAASLRSETSVDGSVGDIVRVKGGVTINIASSVKGVL